MFSPAVLLVLVSVKPDAAGIASFSGVAGASWKLLLLLGISGCLTERPTQGKTLR